MKSKFNIMTFGGKSPYRLSWGQFRELTNYQFSDLGYISIPTFNSFDDLYDYCLTLRDMDKNKLFIKTLKDEVSFNLNEIFLKTK